MTSNKLANIDLILIGLLTLGITFGLCILYSADNLHISLAIKQVVKSLLAIPAIVILFYLDKRTIQDLAIPAFLISIAILVLVLLLGYMSKGAQRWIDLGFIKFEPSELVKITLPVALAAKINQQGLPIKGLPLLQCIIMIAIPFTLILKQPDLGTALIVFTVGSFTLFLSGICRKLLIIAFSCTLLAAPLLWHQLHAYQQQRILTLMSPETDLAKHGYHIHQSKIAIGSGGLWGKGFGQGSQVQMGYIPEHKTDFIFSLLSEELGLAGNLLWLSIVLSIGFRSIYLGYLQHDTFSKLSCITLGCSFMLNAWINMAMVSGMIPVVGIPLPLLSYGGTNFVVSLIGFAIILKLGETDPRKQYSW